MKLEIASDDRCHAILVCDDAHNDIAEFFHNEHATVSQSYETALALAKRLVAGCGAVCEVCGKHGGKPHAEFDGLVCESCQEQWAPQPFAVAQAWQDISTAPKDECIMLCVAGFEPAAGRWWPIEGCWVPFNWEGHFESDQEMSDYVSGSRYEPTHWMPLPKGPEVTSTHSRCAKCHCETKGEAALVDGKIWCHPCADSVPSTSRCTCAAIVNPNIPHARTCPLSSTDGASR